MDDDRRTHASGRYDVSTAEAIDLIASAARPTGTEAVPLAAAAGRVLATDLVSLVDRPNADDSALDGYACRAADTVSATPEAPVRLALVGVSHAGRPFEGSVGPGEAVQIATGAVIPDGADAVIGVENARREGEASPEPGNATPTTGGDGASAYVLLAAPASVDAVRLRARDLATGGTYLLQGRLLDAANLGLAAAMGHGGVLVARRPRVAVLVTGDELVAPGGSVRRGEVFDANGSALATLITGAGAEPVLVTTVGDAQADLETAIESAVGTSGGIDLIVTSGGVSRGERDAVRDLLLARGRVSFWRVRVRPGGPTMFGHLGGVPVLGLPGNPVSSIVTFLLFGRAYLDTALGRTSPLPYHDRVQAVAGGTFSAGAKEVLHRATLQAHGPTVHALPFEDQSSAVLRSLTESGALVVTPPHHTSSPGDTVDAMVLTPHLR